MNQLISFSGVYKSFKQGEENISILENIDFFVEENKTTIILGYSGSGKTTILNIINNIDNIDSGILNRKDNISISYVTQSSNFIEELSIEQNLLFSIYNKKNSLNLYEIAKYFNCENTLKKKPSNLSGGEKQRINIIRGIIVNPDLLILDEPTSSLDYDNKFKIIDYINNVQKERHLTIILVTHDLEIIEHISNKNLFKISNKKIQFLV